MQGREKSSTWDAMNSWIQENRIEPFAATIGTGGNIRTLHKLLGQNGESMNIEELQGIITKVKDLSIEQRIEQLGLREDRADVLPFASEIYLTAVSKAGTDKILVPNVGLKDGIIEMLVTRNT